MGGSTQLNLLEILKSRGDNDHMTVSHEFGVVQLFRTCSNHSITHGSRSAMKLDMSSGCFNSAKLPQTTED